MQIITGIGESEHVTSMQHRAIFEMVIGNDSYILNKGELLEPEAVPFHLEDPLLAQLGQNRGHGAALHTEVVRQLLPVKGDGK